MGNIEEYVNLIYDFLLYRGVSRVITAFREGFCLICGVYNLKCFTSLEIEEFICGSLEIKWDENTLYENIKPEHGYSKTSRIFDDLIKFMCKLDKFGQRQFLIFTTGTPRLPIGGFNQLAGEVMEDDDDLKKDAFMCNKPKWQRIIILIAGVCMNFLLAIIFLFILSCGWGSSEQSSIVAGVISGSSAEEVGIVKGDKILKLNGHNASNLDSLNVVNLLKRDGDINEYVIEHKDGSKDTYKVELKSYVMNAKTGETISVVTEENTVDKILEENNLTKEDIIETKLAGINFDTQRKKGFFRSIKYAFSKFFNTAGLMFRIIFYLITGSLGLDALSGPVGMYTVIDTATNVGSASYGLYNLIYLLVFL